MDQPAHAQSRLNAGHGLFEVTCRPRAFLRSAIVSVTTVSAAFRLEGRFHCVPLRDATGTTHDGEPLLEGPHSPFVSRGWFQFFVSLLTRVNLGTQLLRALTLTA